MRNSAVIIHLPDGACCPCCGDELNPRAVHMLFDLLWCRTCVDQPRAVLVAIAANLAGPELAAECYETAGLTIWTPRQPAGRRSALSHPAWRPVQIETVSS